VPPIYPDRLVLPNSIETRLGPLRFSDGLRGDATVEKVYDNIDFMRGVDVFLNTISATSALANVPI
jgi:hypothetical protein